MLNGQGLPPGADSEDKDKRYAPTVLRAFAAQLELIILQLSAASTPHERYASTKGEPAPARQPPPLQSARLRLNSLTGLPRAQLGGLLCTQAEDMAQGVPGAARAVHRTAFAWASSMLEASPGQPLSRYEQLATLQQLVNEVFDARNNMQQFLEEQEELWLAEAHIAFGAASRIRDDEDEARENELLRARPVHFLAAQENERLRAQDEDNAQHLEQENERLRIQAGIEPDCTVAARQGEFQELGQPTTVAVVAADPETGRAMRARDGHDRRRAL